METSTILGRVSPVPRGEYDPEASYERLDVVRYSGSSYLVLRSVQGVTPEDSADYMLLAKQGASGDPGQNGTTFTPVVSSDGDLSWTNDGGLSNPASVNIKGPPGSPGQKGDGFTIKGYFPTLEALEAAVPAPEEGDNYGVGSSAPYDIYTWDAVHLTWVNNGTIQGPPGGPGDPGPSGATFTPSVSSDGDLSWTNDQGLTDPAPVNIKGGPGPAGPAGPGVPAGGTEGQVLKKRSNVDYDTYWADEEGGGSSIVAIPSQSGTLTYNGSTQQVVLNDYDPKQVELSGDLSGADAGEYTITATLRKTGSFWEDLTREPKTIKWTIGRAACTLPTTSSALVYTGSAQAPVWDGYDAAVLIKGGDLTGTNAGDYTTSFTPTENYQFSDGSTDAKEAAWSIAKAQGTASISPTAATLTTDEPTTAITVTHDGTGTVSAASSDTDIAEVSVSGDVVTVTGNTPGNCVVTIQVAGDNNYTAPAAKECNITCTVFNNHIFGVCWNYGNSSPALQRLTVNNDPYGMVTDDITTEPVPAVGTGSGSSPFDEFYPWNKIDEWNVVNGSITVKRGQSGFSRTARDVVVFIPEFYYRVIDVPAQSRRYFYISQKPAAGFARHPGSGRCVGKYNTGAGYVSESGLAPLVSITRGTARVGHKGRGAKFNNYDFAAWCAIQLLYLVEYAHLDSQSKVGSGYVSGSAAINTGGCDVMFYHTGRPSGTNGKTAVMYRWIENLWGNVCEWVDGVNCLNRILYICTDPDNFADDTVNGDYTSSGLGVQNSNYITGFGYSAAFPWAFIPQNTSGGSESIYVCDYATGAFGVAVKASGTWTSGASTGMFFFDGGNNLTDKNASTGARMLYVPTAEEIRIMTA